MIRTQPFLRVFKLITLFILVGCGPAVPEALPTVVEDVIEGEIVEPVSTETAVLPTHTPIPPIPTAVTQSETIEEATAESPQPIDSNGSIGDPYAPELGNIGYDVQLYDIQLKIDPASTTIAGGVMITAVATEPISQLSLDFVGYEISQVQVNDNEAAYSRKDNKLIVALPAGVATGDSFTIGVQYSGSPVTERSRFVQFAPSIGLFFVDNETAYILSEPDGTRYWLPNNDHPRDKAIFRFELTVADGLTAVANGILQDVIPSVDGSQTFIWEHDHLMASYLATIAVGEYVRLEDESPNGVPLRHYVFPEDRANFVSANAVTGEAIDWMSDLFGTYPFETFGFVTADAPGASLETQTMVILSTRMINEVTVIHEIAHMWFGNWVSLDSWSEMWRNEGFATYVSLMWEYRDDPEGLALEMAAIETAVEENGPLPGLAAPPPERLFSFNTYFGGALMVHELRQTMGDDAFFAGLKLYFERYGGGTATDAEFQAIMEEASGQSLTDFFEEWLQ